MALKDNWTNKVDGEDYILASDINAIANELIETQNDLILSKQEVDIKLTQSESDLKLYVDEAISGALEGSY